VTKLVWSSDGKLRKAILTAPRYEVKALLDDINRQGPQARQEMTQLYVIARESESSV
jgi:hypothetical protein